MPFWAGALGEPLPLTQRLGEGTARVHPDIHTDDLDAEVVRLGDLGARRVQRVEFWQVLRDPARLLFCVLPDPPGTLHGGALVYGGTGDNINQVNSGNTVIVDGNLITPQVVQCLYVGPRP